MLSFPKGEAHHRAVTTVRFLSGMLIPILIIAVKERMLEESILIARVLLTRC